MTNMTDQTVPPVEPPAGGPPGGPPPGGPPPGGPPPAGGPPPRVRLLRRSSTDRVASGVCGGLGEYLGVDPVLFRVLFATTAFFGVGIVAYLVAWAAIPERGAARAPADSVIGELRRRRVPFWLVATVAVAIAWAVLFSWWSPWPFFPVVIATIILVIALNRRAPADLPPDAVTNQTATSAPTAPPSAQQTVPYQVSDDVPADYRPVGSEFGDWMRQSGRAWRLRRARNRPVRLVAWGVLAAALLGLGIADAVSGIRIPVYFWTVGAIVLVAVVVGAVLRRPVWGLTVLLVPVVFGLLAFGWTRVSLHDGSGDREYTPRTTADLQAEYRMAFGRTVFDLRQLSDAGGGRTVQVRQAAGQVQFIVPETSQLHVHASVHAGAVLQDDVEQNSGVNFDRDVVVGAGDGQPLTFDVRIETGAVTVDHRA